MLTSDEILHNFVSGNLRVCERSLSMRRGPKVFSILSVALVLILIFSAASTVVAQTGTTSLRGSVVDKSGAAIVGAKVSLANQAQAVHREATTDSTGAYEFRALPPGHYVLIVELTGFRK